MTSVARSGLHRCPAKTEPALDARPSLRAIRSQCESPLTPDGTSQRQSTRAGRGTEPPPRGDLRSSTPPAQDFCRGASWNRTSDLSIISAHVSVANDVPDQPRCTARRPPWSCRASNVPHPRALVHADFVVQGCTGRCGGRGDQLKERGASGCELSRSPTGSMDQPRGPDSMTSEGQLAADTATRSAMPLAQASIRPEGTISASSLSKRIMAAT